LAAALAVCALILGAASTAARDVEAAVLDARFGPHGYGAWQNLTRLLGPPEELGLWLDKERYDTLDASGGGFILAAPDVGEPETEVRLSLSRAPDGKPAGAPARRSVLPSDRGCIAFDLDLRGLAPGRYVLAVELVKGGAVRFARSAGFRVEAAERPQIKRKRVRIDVRNPARGRAHRGPTHAGVPLPKGELRDPANVRVLYADGREIPAQAKVRARWDRHGSVRWLGLWFTLDHAEGATVTPVFLEYGAEVKPGRVAAAPLTATETERGWTVSNGLLQVHLDAASGRVLEKVFYDADADGAFADEELAWDATAGGPYLVDDAGRRFEALADASPAFTVEENGPECFVCRTESWFVGAAPPTFRADPGLCRQVTRVRIARGVPRLDVSYTWINTARSFEARYADIGFSGLVPGADRVVFGTDRAACAETSRDAAARMPAYAESVTAESGFWLLQDQWDRYGVWMRYRQTGHQVPSERSLWQRRMVTSGTHAPGWGALLNDRVGVAIGCEDFWQNYPKEVSAAGRTLTFHSWPAHNWDHDRELSEGDLNRLHFVHESKLLNFLIPGEVVNFPHENWHTAKYYLHFSAVADAIGLAKTHEVKLCFFGANQSLETVSAEVSAALQPAIAAADPHAVVASQTLGPIPVHDPERFPELERQLERMFKCEIRLQELERDYGMFVFGGGHSGINLKERHFNVYRGWRNTHHNTPRTPWLYHLRSGDPFYFLCGLRNARKVMDMGFCHHSRPDLEKLTYGPGKKKGALCDYKGLVPWHSGNRNPDYNSMTDFLLYFTYLTGNERGRDVAAEWWDCTLRFAAPPGTSRSASGTIAALLALYQDTWDRRMLPMIHATYVNQCRGQDPEWGWFNEWQNYAPWLERYWDFTGSEHAREVLVKWADAFVMGWGDMSSLWDHFVNIPAYAYFATGDLKYVRYLKGVLWEEVRSSYDDPKSPLDGLWRTGHVSLGHYYMQRALLAMEAIRRAGGEDPGVGETRWALHPDVGGSPPEYFVDFQLLDERDEPITLLLVGIFRDPKFRITAWAPDGAKALEQDFEAHVHRTHGSNRPAPSNRLTIPPDGKKGVYRVRIDCLAKQHFTVLVPLTPDCKEVYPVRGNKITIRAGRAYFEVPKDSGEYVVDMTRQKGGPFPSWVFDGEGNPITRGTVEVRSDGTVKRGFPVTLDSSKCQRYMLMSNRGTASFFEITGKSPPKYMATSWERLFDPEKGGAAE